jgi:hypothetical protein
MDLRAWTYANQIALDHLEVHLLHWQKLLLLQEPLLVRHATAEPLQASLRRHTDPSLRALTLLEQQRVLLAQLEAQLAKRLASESVSHFAPLPRLLRQVSTFNRREPCT